MPELCFGAFQEALSILGRDIGLPQFPPADWADLPLNGRDLNRALSESGGRPADDIWAQLYDNYQTHHVRPLPTSMTGQAVELYARFGLPADPLGWIPVQVIGYGLVMGHFLPTQPKPPLPEIFTSYVLLDVTDYVTLQKRYAGINFTNLQTSLCALTPAEFESLRDGGPREVIPFLPRLFPEDTKSPRLLQELKLAHAHVDWSWVGQRLDGLEALWCRALRQRPSSTLFELIRVQGTRIGIVDPTTLSLTREELQFPPLKATEKDWAVKSQVIPIFVRGEIVVLGSPLADDESVRTTVVSALVGSRVFFCLISEVSFKALAPCWYGAQAVKENETVSEGEPILPYDGKVVIVASDSREVTDPNWAKTFVNQFIAQAVDRGASDIHIEPMGEQFRLRFRIDGVLVEPYDRFPAAFCPFAIRRVKTMAGMDISNTREGLDGRLKLPFRARDVDFRVVTMPVNGSKGEHETCVLRILDAQSAPKKIEEVFFDEAGCAALRRSFTKPTGLILMTGPTGCGKSTTLYSVLGELNTPEKKVITLEDPVERRVLGVNQTQIIAPNTFAKSLRVALRADPDVILVGEIRDEETAELSIKASQTGHLVFSTLHANSAIATITRLNDLGIKFADIAASLLAVTAQRLLRKLCLSCRTRAKISALELEKFQSRKINSPLLDDGFIYRHMGCPYCFGSGYKGRAAVMELLEVDEALKNIVAHRDGFSPGALRNAAVERGFTNLYTNGVLAVSRGITDLCEVRIDLTDIFY